MGMMIIQKKLNLSCLNCFNIALLQPESKSYGNVSFYCFVYHAERFCVRF